MVTLIEGAAGGSLGGRVAGRIRDDGGRGETVRTSRPGTSSRCNPRSRAPKAMLFSGSSSSRCLWAGLRSADSRGLGACPDGSCVRISPASLSSALSRSVRRGRECACRGCFPGSSAWRRTCGVTLASSALPRGSGDETAARCLRVRGGRIGGERPGNSDREESTASSSLSA